MPWFASGLASTSGGELLTSFVSSLATWVLMKLACSVPKFLLLFRRFVNAAFRFLAREGWSGEGVDRLNAMLLKENGPLK